jgi:hypothetical protein
MARIVAFIPDLLFGSNVLAALRSAGHEPVLATDSGALARELPAAELLIVDLTFEAHERIEQARLARPPGVRTLAFYAHVETDVRTLAEEAGFDRVVPRSRMARDAAGLVEQLLADRA